MLPSARPVPIPVAARGHGPRQVFRLGPRLPAFPLPVAHEGSWSTGLTAAGPLPILTGFPFDAGRFRRPWTRYSRQGAAACQRVTDRGRCARQVEEKPLVAAAERRTPVDIQKRQPEGCPCNDASWYGETHKPSPLSPIPGNEDGRRGQSCPSLCIHKNTAILNRYGLNKIFSQHGTPPAFGDRQQGLPPRSPDMLHPSKESALERGWGELEGGRGNTLCASQGFPLPPSSRTNSIASPDAR